MYIILTIAISITCLLVSRPQHCQMSLTEMYQFLIATLIYALCSEGKANYCACQTTLCVVEVLVNYFEPVLYYYVDLLVMTYYYNSIHNHSYVHNAVPLENDICLSWRDSSVDL